MSPRPYDVVERRQGDLVTCFADVSKDQEALGWKAELEIKDMVKDAWRFEMNNK